MNNKCPKDNYGNPKGLGGAKHRQELELTDRLPRPENRKEVEAARKGLEVWKSRLN